MSESKVSDPKPHLKYEFSSDVLDIIIGGKSAIDSAVGFRISTTEEAERFVRSYGFNLEDPIEQAESLGNFHESLNFIRRYFLQPDNPDGLRLEVPRKIVELTDVRELFILASSEPSMDSVTTYLRNWACSILKVMHTIAHVDKDIRVSYYADVQKQIFDRFYKFIHRTEAGQLYLGEKDDDYLRVDLVAFETKPKKSRDSILIKLLHKPENVAEDIFDRVGIRFITPTRLDAVRVIKFLKSRMVVMPPNIKPSRSRNTLIQLADLKARISENLPRFQAGEISEQDLRDILEQTQFVEGGDSAENKHTSQAYRSIQFTARQLIKTRNPLHSDLKDLKSKAKTLHLPEMIGGIIDRIELKYLTKEVRFFYPYEVQVTDLKSHEENERGRSAHSEYKKAQLQSAMKRVMGALVDGSK